jgi:hypothetical protein
MSEHFDADDAQSRQWSFSRNELPPLHARIEVNRTAALYCLCPAPCPQHDSGTPTVIGGEHDGQELYEVPLGVDASGSFNSLCDRASDAQLIAFLDLLLEAIRHRVRHYLRHDHHERAIALRNAATKRGTGFIVW